MREREEENGKKTREKKKLENFQGKKKLEKNSRGIRRGVSGSDDRQQVPAVSRVGARVPDGKADAGVLLDVAQRDGRRPGPARVELF